MANEEAAAHKIIGACSFNGTTIAVIKFFSIAELAEFLTVRGQAAVGPTQRNIFRRDCHAHTRHVGGAKVAADDVAHSLVLTAYTMGSVILGTWTITTMKCGTNDFSINDDAPPGELGHDWLHMGSMVSSPISYAAA